MLGFAQEQEDQAVFVLYISHAEKLEPSCVDGGIHLSGRDGPSASSGGEPSNLLQHVQRSINVDSRVLQKRHKCLPKIVSGSSCMRTILLTIIHRGRPLLDSTALSIPPFEKQRPTKSLARTNESSAWRERPSSSRPPTQATYASK